MPTMQINLRVGAGKVVIDLERASLKDKEVTMAT